MILILLLLSFTSSKLSTDSFVDKRVEIEDCANDADVTDPTDVTEQIKCVASGAQKLKLGLRTEIHIHSVTFTSKPSEMKSKLCKKISEDKYIILVLSDVQSIIYSKGSDVKAILIGADSDTCAKTVLVSDTEIMKRKLVVKTIACVSTEKLPLLQSAKTTETKKHYYVLGNHICFLAPMLIPEYKTKVTTGGKDIDLTVSLYPIEDCPVCPPTKQDTNSTSTNTTTTTQNAASKTGMIVGIVLAVSIVVLGGIGFVMMKK